MFFNLHVRVLAVVSVASAVLIGASVPPVFESVQPELFAAGGAFANAWADFDNDGDLDLFVGFGGTPANRLYRNDDGVFVDVANGADLADARATRGHRVAQRHHPAGTGRDRCRAQSASPSAA